MTKVTHRGFGSIITKLAFVSLLAAGFNLSAAMSQHEVAADAEFAFVSPNDAVNAESYELLVNAGESTTVNLPPSGQCNCFLYMKGSGKVTLKTPDNYNGGDQVTFIGGIAADSTVTVHVDGVSTINVGRENSANNINYPAIDIANMTFEQDGGRLVLTNKCTARALPSRFEVAPGAMVALQGDNPLRLGSAFTLTDYDVVVLNRASIPDGCTITVSPGRTLGLKPAVTAKRDGSTYNWSWAGQTSYFDESFNIVLGGKGARVHCRNVANLNLFTPVTGVGEVVFWPDVSMVDESTLLFRGKFYTSPYKAGSGVRAANPVYIPINTEAEPLPSDAWKSKVAHWFDASDASTIVPFSFDPIAAFGWSGAKNEYNGHQIIIGWKDKVEGSNISLYNKRIWTSSDIKSDYVLQVMPYLVENGLNGKPYLSFGDYNKANVPNARYNSNGALIAVTEARRLWVWNTATIDGDNVASGATTTFTPKYCIMVFGSQQGGGKCVLGDAAGDDCGNLARGTTTTNGVWTTYDSGCSFKVDGVDIKPNVAKPNGKWQIVSMDMTATNIVINGLGNHQTNSQYGGQNYAEIIFFNVAPTDAERRSCESYLAEKWGIKPTYSFRSGLEKFSELSGGEDTTVEIRDYSASDLTGSPKTYPTSSEVMLSGNYRGTINVASGKTIVLYDRPAPLDAYDMPQQNNIVAWFDPSLEGAIDYIEADNVPNGIARLYSRTASGVDKSDGAYWMSMQANKDGSTPGIANYKGRYPFLVDISYGGLAGHAPTKPWMDFTINASGDNTSNTLRSHRLPDLNVEDASSTFTTFRSLFMALDSSAGGGNPVGDTVEFNGKFKPRADNGKDYTQPIWSSENTVTMAHTWLDTNEVNGTTTGYSGRGEVLGFETASDFTPSKGLFFGYYNSGRGQYEHIAETIIYSTTLSESERLTVQKYLMAKWFGDMNYEFCDFSGATVTGAGNVKSASLRNLPTFDAGFTGTLSGGSNMTFRVKAQGASSEVVDPIAVRREVALDSTCNVTINIIGSGNLKSGTYTLLSATSLTGGETITVTMVSANGLSVGKCTVSIRDNAIVLDVKRRGLAMCLR